MTLQLYPVELKTESDALVMTFASRLNPASETLFIVERDRSILLPEIGAHVAAAGLSATLQSSSGEQTVSLGIPFAAGAGGIFVADEGIGTLQRILVNPYVKWIHVETFTDRLGTRYATANTQADAVREALGLLDFGVDVANFASLLGHGFAARRH